MPPLAELPMVNTISNTSVLDQEWLRNMCLDAGADDVGFVAMGLRDG